MNMSKQILIEAKVANAKKSTGVGYLLFLFLGGFGAHRFYMGRTGTAVTQLLLFIGGVLTMGILTIPLVIWLFVDLFLIPGMVRDHMTRVRRDATLDVAAMGD